MYQLCRCMWNIKSNAPLTTMAEPHRPKERTYRRFMRSPITPLIYRPCMNIEQHTHIYSVLLLWLFNYDFKKYLYLTWQVRQVSKEQILILQWRPTPAKPSTAGQHSTCLQLPYILKIITCNKNSRLYVTSWWQGLESTATQSLAQLSGVKGQGSEWGGQNRECEKTAPVCLFPCW